MLTVRSHFLQPEWLDEQVRGKGKIKSQKQRSELLVRGTCSRKQNCNDKSWSRCDMWFCWEGGARELGRKGKAATGKK